MEDFNPDLTLGAYQIGALVSYLLLGMTTTQAYIYYTRFPKDSIKLKAFVAVVCLCEVGHGLCIGSSLYTYTITHYGKTESPFIVRAPQSLLAAVFFSGIIGPSVQSFFSRRIYALSQSLWIPCIVWILAFVRFVGTTAVSVIGLRMGSLFVFVEQWGWLVTTAWVISVFNDLLIAVTLVVILWRRKTLLRSQTAALVDKIIKWTVETGMLTSSTGIIMLIFFVEMKDTFIWLAMFTIGARLFANSLLASLNSRTAIREMAAITTIPIPVSSLVINVPSSSVPVSLITEPQNVSKAENRRSAHIENRGEEI